MAHISPFLLAKQLEGDVIRLLSSLDMVDLAPSEQQTVRELKHGLIDIRLEVQDYELAETREMQLKNAAIARDMLHNVQSIISANTINVFGAVDVAHLSARIGQISDNLR